MAKRWYFSGDHLVCIINKYIKLTTSLHLLKVSIAISGMLALVLLKLGIHRYYILIDLSKVKSM